MNNNIKGIDISNNDGAVNFSEVVGDSVKYVYIKATEGETYQDNYMDTFYNGCKETGLKVGAYHFLVGTSSPEAQAKNFYNQIKGYNWDLVPMLDVETSFSGLAYYVQRFIDAFKELCSLELGIYSYTSFIGYLNSIQDTIKTMPFWEANYNGQPWSLSDTFFINRIGHQYTEEGSIAGVNCNCDVNVFTEGVLVGQWIQDTIGWWYKYTDGSYPTKWFKIKGSWYYFKANGYMATGWINDDNKTYYTYSTGQMATGWVQLDNSWYYFDNTGVMQTGWFQDNGNWFYLNSKGIMAIGWQQIDSIWYYLNDKGIMVTGWIKLEDYWYYLNDKGAMVTGWQQINDNSYYFYSDGKMAVNTVTPDGYTVDGDGAWDSSIPKK